MPEPATKEKITEEQAMAALEQLREENLPEEERTTAAAPSEEKVPGEATPVGTEPEKKTEEEAKAPEDDVASLRKRLEEREAAFKEHEERAKEREEALQQRYRQNEEILRDRVLRKSTVADKALKHLKAVRVDPVAVSEAELDQTIRDIESSMNRASPSYVPPDQHPAPQEDQALVVNDFLNEKRMTAQESEQFGNWMKEDGAKRLSPVEQAVAHRDLDAFLRIAHRRWEDSIRESTQKKTNDAVEAVRTVQRTQKEASRSAALSPGGPRKQPVAPEKQIDVKKLTRDDVSQLLRMTVEENR